jgi:hypothetical protein
MHSWPRRCRHRPEPSHGIAMHGEPALPADFSNFPYVNPDAPKGGRVEYAWPGTFDSVNPFIVQGSGARGSLDLIFGNNRLRHAHDALRRRALHASTRCWPKTIETDDARSFAEFTLDARAKFSDGTAGHAGGRHLHRRAAARQGLAALRRDGRQDRQDGESRRARRALHLQAARPRTAADPRPDADPAEARDRRRDASTSRR